MPYSKAFAAAAGLSLALAGGVAPFAALAQESAQAEAADRYDDATLERFVLAALEVGAVRQAYVPRVQGAANEEEARAIAEDARSEMQAAVEQVDGMSVDTYVEIGEAATDDEALAARITEIAQRVQQGAAPQNR
ncbi:DUF4168 domain-containing protein [Meridianimarinicoccus roseus]|nr:DUF4168 domain-containing protein [Meridianimarinicoccus roseus]